MDIELDEKEFIKQLSDIVEEHPDALRKSFEKNWVILPFLSMMVLDIKQEVDKEEK